MLVAILLTLIFAALAYWLAGWLGLPEIVRIVIVLLIVVAGLGYGFH